MVTKPKLDKMFHLSLSLRVSIFLNADCVTDGQNDDNQCVTVRDSRVGRNDIFLF